MAKLQIKIPHIAWRDGRPRFNPGPGLRRLGYKGEDLKDSAGNWLGLEASIQWANKRSEEIAARRDAVKMGAKIQQPKRRAPIFAVSSLIANWQQSPKFQNLAPKTQEWYRQMGNALANFDEEFWAAPAAGISTPIAYGLYEALEVEKGLTTARGIIATCRSAWSYGKLKGLVGDNPFRELKMNVPRPRVRVGTIHEMKQLIAAADAFGRPEIGDAIMIGLCTGQRQGDRLSLVEDSRKDGRINLRQNKTGALVSMPELNEVTRRLNAAKVRRANWKVKYPHLIQDEKDQKPFSITSKHYSRKFREIREYAVSGDPAKGLKPTPSLVDFTDQDLRDTAVTWLANARCHIPEICSITGHSLESAQKILKHYLATTPEQADNAMAKLKEWIEAKGGL
ncbi:hypothetical protein SAMN05444141_102643 [Pseudovibrio denitrificans]|uniref:Phage integrase family protein n=1 Tax=Pseudovibrio denitrificans TaxID=258256 RepID=A0A1I6ZVN2_9HYPH|nr:hypothetical protein [Pseudovibrio denitrificans]SFT66758.1 hypothetical protein SAMN05444141_102643 [Pseudovibrio denitrificans]